MADTTHDGAVGSLTFVRGLGWLAFALVVMAAAGGGAYYRLGGIDTPLQKAGVVGAALLGLGVAMWTKRILVFALYAGLIVLAIWLVDHYWLHA